jgi:hypothetical protein
VRQAQRLERLLRLAWLELQLVVIVMVMVIAIITAMAIMNS